MANWTGSWPNKDFFHWVVCHDFAINPLPPCFCYPSSWVQYVPIVYYEKGINHLMPYVVNVTLFLSRDPGLNIFNLKFLMTWYSNIYICKVTFSDSKTLQSSSHPKRVSDSISIQKVTCWSRTNFSNGCWCLFTLTTM